MEKEKDTLLKGMIKHHNMTRIITIELSTEYSLNFTEFQGKVKSEVQIRDRFAKVGSQRSPSLESITSRHRLAQV